MNRLEKINVFCRRHTILLPIVAGFATMVITMVMSNGFSVGESTLYGALIMMFMSLSFQMDELRLLLRKQNGKSYDQDSLGGKEEMKINKIRVLGIYMGTALLMWLVMFMSESLHDYLQGTLALIIMQTFAVTVWMLFENGNEK